MSSGVKSPRANNRAPAKNGHVLQDSKQPSRRRRRLTPRELEDYQQRLLDKRRELIGDVRRLHDEAMNGGSGGGGGSNSMPIHMAERGSETWEQALTLRLSETQESVLRDVDVALQRIHDGTYGVCEAAGGRIPGGRLRALPWTRYCIECARSLEYGAI